MSNVVTIIVIIVVTIIVIISCSNMKTVDNTEIILGQMDYPFGFPTKYYGLPEYGYGKGYAWIPAYNQ